MVQSVVRVGEGGEEVSAPLGRERRLASCSDALPRLHCGCVLRCQAAVEGEGVLGDGATASRGRAGDCNGSEEGAQRGRSRAGQAAVSSLPHTVQLPVLTGVPGRL